MPDREKVINAIDICLGHGVCNDCPYFLSGRGYTTMKCRDYMFRDALALLKEQEAIVRCKDCKYWNSNLGEYCEKINGYPGAEWFCANGERKEGR